MNLNKRGIDISNHNSNVNYLDLKANGCEYAYIKATEGRTYQDPKTQLHYAGCKKAGIKTGFYHYFKSTSTPEDQAENFYNIIKKYDNNIYAMLDVEEDWNGMSTNIVRFIKKWEQISKIPLGIYTYSGFLGNFTQEAIKCIKDLPCWIANYRADFNGVKTGFFTNIVGWQNSDKGVIGKFRGDTNYFSNEIEINKVLTIQDIIMEDTLMYFNNDKTGLAGQLHENDRVEVIEYYSDLTKLKSNDSFVYVETNKLKSHHNTINELTGKQMQEALEKIINQLQDLTNKLK